MRILRKWKVRGHEYFLLKYLKHNVVKRQPVDYNLAHSIGVLFHIDQLQHQEIIDKFIQRLKDNGKEVKILAFLDDKEQQPNLNFNHFSLKELNWFYQPKHPKVDQFINTQFDYLINLDDSGSLPLTYISACSKAQIRVGSFTDKTYCFDFMIETHEQQNLQHFITQLDFLLTRLNSRKHEKTIV